MFVRLLVWLRNGASAVVTEAYGGEVQGGSLLRITNQRGLLRFLGVEPVVALRCPRVAVAKKVISLARSRKIGPGNVTAAPPARGVSA